MRRWLHKCFNNYFERVIMKIQTLIAALVLTVGGAAFAQAPAGQMAPTNPTATSRIDQRQVNQERRVEQGEKSGSLTPKEAARLDKRESKIEADKVAAKSDGKVTKSERRKLRHEENHASRAIHRQKHDRQSSMPGAAK
jgi:hypothetical protein